MSAAAVGSEEHGDVSHQLQDLLIQPRCAQI